MLFISILTMEKTMAGIKFGKMLDLESKNEMENGDQKGGRFSFWRK
jgi:hypothetical protein